MPEILGVEVHIWADGVALSFTFLAVILCGLQIHNHIYHNHVPQVRKYIIRILLMVIVYGVESLCGLYYPEWSIYLNALRDCYEALVIYSFYQLLIQSLGGHDAVQSALQNVPMSTMPHMSPFKWCCRAWSLTDTYESNNSFLRNCTIGVLQYCFVEPTCTVITYVMEMTHIYKEGKFRYDAGYPYIAFIISLSQTWAIYCLVLFYLTLKKQSYDSQGYQLFTQMRPIPKFLCIKGVVFFTYWQSIAIAFAVYFNMIKPTETWTSNNIATGLQDTIICIEMFIAAIAHIYAFKVADFRESGYTPLAPHKVLFDVANVTDIVNDAQEVLSTSNLRALQKLQRKRKRRRMYNKRHRSDYDMKHNKSKLDESGSDKLEFAFEESSDELSSDEKTQYDYLPVDTQSMSIIETGIGSNINNNNKDINMMTEDGNELIESKIDTNNNNKEDIGIEVKNNEINEDIIKQRRIKKSKTQSEIDINNNNNNNNNIINNGNINAKQKRRGRGWQIVRKIKSKDTTSTRKINSNNVNNNSSNMEDIEEIGMGNKTHQTKVSVS